eukprot:s60_g12.t1
MVDRTVYDPDKTPDLALRQVFGRQRVNQDLCKLAADSGLLTVETFAMLGDDIASVKATIKNLVPDHAKFGTDAPAQELALTSLAAVWKTCCTMQDHFAARRAKMEEDPSKVPEIPGEDHAEFREVFVGRHPDVLLPPHREPHRKFVERVQRDFLVHGSVYFYEVGEIRTRNEQIAQKTGLSKNAEDLLRVVMIDQPAAASSETQVMDKLHAFFITLEYLNICEFSIAAGPLKYLAELEEWRHENRGLALLLTVDTLIRKKVHRVGSDQRKKFTNFSSALLEVLNNHKQLWNDARSSAELDKFKQALQTPVPSTPVSKKRDRSASRSPPKSSPKAKKNKARRARQKAQLKQARETLAAHSGSEKPSGNKRPSRDERVPAKEWQTITSFKYSGPHEPLVAPATNDDRCFVSGQTRQLCLHQPWPSWAELPAQLSSLRPQGPFFLELFAGKAGITEAVHLLGVPVLPPVDIEPSPLVSCPRDLVDAEVWAKIMAIVAAGLVFFLHCGTPCNTFTAARKLDGGPPPLRSHAEPEGLPTLSGSDQLLVFLGNLFLERTAEACLLVFVLGGDFTIENPLLSLIWETAHLRHLFSVARSFNLDFDQCAFGTPWLKPTRLFSSTEVLDVVCVRCPGDHVHEKLKGKVWDPKQQKMVFRTKAAQVYPWSLCSTVALQIAQIFVDPFAHLAPSFALTTPAADRKRAVLSGRPWKLHRQAETAHRALAAGYQLKRGALKPLLEVELEPGEAIKWVMQVPHPFSQAAGLPADLDQALQHLVHTGASVVQERYSLVSFWARRAQELLPLSVHRIMQQPDAALRRLLLGTSDPKLASLGSVCHVALYEDMLRACKSVDTELHSLLLTGFPIVGKISANGRWPPYAKDQKVLPVRDALSRAWEIRSKIVNRVSKVPCSENLQKIWEATIEDVAEGSCLGPFRSAEEVTNALGEDDWIPTQRFEVVQKNKVRGCDSATTNMINQVTEITEKLQLPSTDVNVAALRRLRTLAPEKALQGWVLDERKAYRQVAVRPDHRKFSVICLKNPSTDKPEFFIMVGHSFGLVSAVYNYNRRSAAINEILVKLFGLVAFSFYDDKYGFETAATAPSARYVAECVHTWLGARFDQKKLQLSSCPTILGVTYNLDLMQLEIKKERREDLLDEIDSVLKSKLLDPGSAGKLKGKLMFGASQLWGKVGRAFLRAISERQYCKFPPQGEFTLGKALEESLRQWRKLIDCGPPRPIDVAHERLSDAVIFTDGFTPDPRSSERLPDRIGAVLFDRRLNAPRQFTAVVPDRTFADRVRGADIILLIDSEAVEGALIKGYSSREDLCQLVSVFWDLALSLRVARDEAYTEELKRRREARYADLAKGALLSVCSSQES